MGVAAAGATGSHTSHLRSAAMAFIRLLGRPGWTPTSAEADRSLPSQRKDCGLARTTVAGKAGELGRYFEFLVARYQAEIHDLTGYVVTQPIDESNRQSRP